MDGWTDGGAPSRRIASIVASSSVASPSPPLSEKAAVKFGSLTIRLGSNHSTPSYRRSSTDNAACCRAVLCVLSWCQTWMRPARRRSRMCW